MAKTVIGLFDTHLEAQNVVQDLMGAGFSRDQISLVARDNDTSSYDERQVGDTANAAGDGAGAGAVGGTVLGGTLGLLIGTGLLVIPGVGPVLAAGPLAAAIGTTTAAVGATALGAGIGAATGGLVGGLIGAGVPDEDANYYAEGVRRGGTLVTVSADDTMADRAYSIMQQNGAVNVRERGENWRSSEGWTNFDPSGSPYRSSGDTGDDWRDSSKIGTGTGTVSGAATGAAIGSAGGPVGTVVGGIAGAAVGAGLGAAGDVAGEKAEDMDNPGSRGTNTGRSDYSSTGSGTGNDWEESSKIGTGTGTVSGAATGAAIGSAGGPVGTVVGGIAGAVVGGGAGAAGDVAGERAEDMDDETYGTQRGDNFSNRSNVTDTGRSDYAMGQRETPMTGNRSDFARGQRDFESFNDDFRSHYQSMPAMSGRSYDDYSSAYRYGYDTSSDTTYSGRSWESIEPELRRRWEIDRPNSWEQFKDSVRYAWERTQGRR